MISAKLETWNCLKPLQRLRRTCPRTTTARLAAPAAGRRAQAGCRPATSRPAWRLPASTTSFHLAALERAGLTQSTRQGRQIIHAARIAGLRQLLAFLTETCCSGRPELCGDIARLLPPIPDEDKGMTPAFNVLFLCTHNSARSIMAEAILNKIGAGRFRAYSAGSQPIAAPLPEVIDKLRAFGHDTEGLRSKSWDEFTGPSAPQMDFVITLCDTLDGPVCPDFGELGRDRGLAAARSGQVHRQCGRAFGIAERALRQPAPAA